MGSVSRAIEVTGAIDGEGGLHLDVPLPVAGPGRVRVIILIPEQPEPDEREWLRAASGNPAFAFLSEPEEDIYSFRDGRPFDGQG